VNIVIYFSDYFWLFVRTPLVLPWLSDDALFQRGSRRKPLFVLLFMRMMLVKWKGKVLKSGWYCKVVFILKRFSVMVRLVVGGKSVGTQSHIYMCIVVAMKCVRVFVLVLFGVCVLLLLLDRPQN
jgi:hypothetical protein